MERIERSPGSESGRTAFDQPAAPVGGRTGRPYRIMVTSNAVIRTGAALFFLLVPALLVLRETRDPGLRQPQIPRAAWTLHRALAPKIQRWAEARVASDRAGKLSTTNISGTEWPLFGSVFYLLAVDSLQRAWEADPNLADNAPKQYVAEAIEATARLVLDPGQAGWAKKHWGDNYLSTEDRMSRTVPDSPSCSAGASPAAISTTKRLPWPVVLPEIGCVRMRRNRRMIRRFDLCSKVHLTVF